MSSHPLDPFIYSPARGGLAPITELQASLREGDELDGFDRWFTRTHFAWIAVTFLLATTLPSVVAVAIIRALT